MENVRRRDGFIYAPDTAEGFARMKRLGIPRPLFRVQDRLSRLLAAKYRKIVRNLFRRLKARISGRGLTVDGREEDNLADLLRYFDEMAEESRKAAEEAARRSSMSALAGEMAAEWLGGDAGERLDEAYGGDLGAELRPALGRLLAENGGDYLGRLKEDAPRRLSAIMEAWEVSRDKFFFENLDEIRALYIDNSMERIEGEVDLLKRRVLREIVDYAEGRSDTLEISGLAKSMLAGADRLSRYFARDQMQRFNKAVTLATFQNAGVSAVKWVTCRDGRVRESHKALDGKVFPIDALPDEMDDYNCRCGLVPVAWED